MPTIRAFRTADYPSIAALNNVNFPEFTWSAEEIRFDDENRLPKCRAARWVAECDDRVVATAQYDQLASMYNPRKFSIEMVVDPALHNRGIGKRLYAVLVDALREFDPISVDTWSREDMAWRVAFLEHRGFRPDQRVWSSELDLHAFDPSRFRRYVDGLAAQGLAVRTLRGLLDDGALDERELYEMWMEVHDDVPIPPSQDRTRRTLDDWRTRNLGHVSAFPEAYFVAMDGERYVGTSQLWHAPDDAARLRTGLTGVRRAYRGRGIAFGLKVLALEFASGRGYRWVDTENAATNAGMLSINERLGFRKRPAWVHYVGAWGAVAGG